MSTETKTAEAPTVRYILPGIVEGVVTEENTDQFMARFLEACEVLPVDVVATEWDLQHGTGGGSTLVHFKDKNLIVVIVGVDAKNTFDLLSERAPGKVKLKGFAEVYSPSEEVFEDLTNRFSYHPPLAGQAQRYESLRRVLLQVSQLIVNSTPRGREQALALTKLEEVCFWANASIARHEMGAFLPTPEQINEKRAEGQKAYDEWKAKQPKEPLDTNTLEKVECPLGAAPNIIPPVVEPEKVVDAASLTEEELTGLVNTKEAAASAQKLVDEASEK